MRTNTKTLSGLTLLSGLLLLNPMELRAAEYDGTMQKVFSVAPGGKLTIQADRGTIVVTTDGSDKAQVRVFRKVKGGSKENAEELFGNHEVTFAQNGNQVSVMAKNKKPAKRVGGPFLSTAVFCESA